jgi:hypothetical protein
MTMRLLRVEIEGEGVFTKVFGIDHCKTRTPDVTNPHYRFGFPNDRDQETTELIALLREYFEKRGVYGLEFYHIESEHVDYVTVDGIPVPVFDSSKPFTKTRL